jgi:hypothetical protein
VIIDVKANSGSLGFVQCSKDGGNEMFVIVAKKSSLKRKIN